jgi:hypothetical protein
LPANAARAGRSIHRAQNPPSVFDEPVDLVEQRWYFLRFVNYDEPVPWQRVDLFAQKRGTLAEPD